ncbi:MAG: DUF5683 domain-containing protein [Tannerella sp.]|jgi:hypothetical protein|nr:DUF5683 domain-containing protein [Tannerella sp.]
MAFAIFVLNGLIFVVKSQDLDSIATNSILLETQDTTSFLPVEEGDIVLENSIDTVQIITIPDSVIISEILKIDSIITPKTETFKPNPTKAVILSAIFPGLGQIYNRKYWKLPIVYGGFLGLTYAITWNNKNLQDYGQAYKDLSNDLINNADKPENWAQSWQNFTPGGSDPALRFNENFKTQLRGGRDYYRRWRDLSIILAAGCYLICMADAYVDAQLFDFDVSPDLSLHIEPVINPGTTTYPQLYGFNCSINF